jgi:cytochrome b561
MQLSDNKSSYGWISIALHWITASLIISLWFIGNSIRSEHTENAAWLASLHVSIAACGYVFFLLRIYWRFKSGHPKITGQKKWAHNTGKIAHYLMLLFLILLLISGPIILWSTGADIVIFNTLKIPSPMGYIQGLSQVSHTLHFYASTALICIATLHLSAAFKHMMFNDDETFLRIFWPKK